MIPGLVKTNKKISDDRPLPLGIVKKLFLCTKERVELFGAVRRARAILKPGIFVLDLTFFTNNFLLFR
jgi:hypothetical protein